MEGTMLGFPEWVRVTHWVNVLFIGYLMRAGIQILGAYPRLYWNDNCTPGTEWLVLTKEEIPRDKPWNGLDQEVPVPAWLGQPGGNNLGLGRHWHFFAVVFWILNGLCYVGLLFGTGQWRRLIPTSGAIFPSAWDTFVGYLTFHIPPPEAFNPFDPLQQIAYAAVVFLLAPFLIVTGAAQSPALEAQFPWFPRLLGGRQFARSLHFLGLVAFSLFIVVHVALVALTYPGENFANIIFGQPRQNQGLAIAIGSGLVIVIVLIYAVTAHYSRKARRRTQHLLGAVIGPPMRSLLFHTRSRQQYRSTEISPYLVVNGYPPATPEYQELLSGNFKNWHLDVHGLVASALRFSLADLQAMPKQTQITKHHCIQGWCGIAEWGGVPLIDIVRRCHPLPTARYIIFRSLGFDMAGRHFYETLDVRLAGYPQTILAYEMNGQPLSVQHGAPLRLRVETQLGFKMVKWLCAIEFAEEYRTVGDGQGGSREDNMYYEQAVSI